MRISRTLFQAVSCALLLGLGAPSCVTEVPPPIQNLFETELQAGPEFLGGFGSAAAISDARQTRASVAIEGFPVGSYSWEIRAGICDAPENILAAPEQYPPLVVEVEGEPVSVTRVLGEVMRAGRAYHARVLPPDEPDGGPPAACGDFTEL